MRKRIIYGCDGRGDGDTPYLTRYYLLDKKWMQICIHVFHRSDFDDMHDHPWNFLSIILWGGYLEETMGYKRRRQRKRVWPGMFLFRRATHRHRVVLKNEKKAVSLVFMGPYIREWGFFTRNGWIHFKKYFTDNGC